MTASRAFAATAVGLALAGAVGAAIVRILAPVPMAAALGFSDLSLVGYLVQGLTWASVGAVLVVRRPGNAVGWLMVVVGVGYAVSQLSGAVTWTFVAEGTVSGNQRAQLAAWLTVLLQLVVVLQVAIGLIFPTGRPQSPRWVRFMWVFWAFAAVFVVLSLSQPGPLQLFPTLENPFGIGPDLRAGQLVSPVVEVLVLAMLAGLGISMISRYRGAGRIERQQLKWFVLSLGVTIAGLGVTSSQLATGGTVDSTALTFYAFAGALVPLAIGVAILRHHLYDIDRLISRGLSWALLSAMLAGVFGGAIVAFQAVLSGVTQGQTLAVAASTLLAFALFQPLRRRVQAAVDRRFFRSSYDAELTVDRFGARLRSEVDLAAIRAEVSGTVVGAVRPVHAAVWIRGGGS